MIFNFPRENSPCVCSSILLLQHDLSLFLAQAMESQIGDFYKDVGELGSLQGLSLPQRGLIAGDKEGAEQLGEVETRIVRLIEPLKERRRILLASKEMHQVAQDLEDEIVSFSVFITCISY